jgi:surface antigen
MYKNILVILILAVLCSSCLTTKTQKGAAGGAVGGAILGQIIGGDSEAMLIGAAIGGMVGYIIGNEMDKYDREQLNKTYESTPSYKKSSWVNPDTGNEYSVTPQPAYQDPANERVCRKAEIEAIIDGKKETTEAIACRENGHWVIQQ